MNLSQVECFLEIVRTGSFTKSAEKLFITQQGVSRQIKALEKYLGFPLFVREKNGVKLTEEGEILAREWEDSFYGLQTAIDKAKDHYLGKSKTLRIALEDMGIATERIVASFSDFEKKETELSVGFKIMPPSEILTQLKNRELDFAIVFDVEFKGMENLNSLPLNDRPLQLAAVMGITHPFAKEAFDMERFLGQPFGILSASSSIRFTENMQQIYDLYGISSGERFVEFRSRRELLVAVSANRCVTILYEPSYYEEKEKLFVVPLALEDLSGRICLFWQGEENTIKAKNLSAVIHSHLQEFNSI